MPAWSKWRVLTVGAFCALLAVLYLWAQSGPAEDTVTVYATEPSAQLHHPTGLAYSQYPNQELFVADTGHNQIKDCYPTVQGITCAVLAGNGTQGYVNGAYYNSEFAVPSGLSGGRYYRNLHGTVYSWVNLYIADSGNHVLRQYCGGNIPPPPYGAACVAGSTTTVTLAGSGADGYVNGPPNSAEFADLLGLVGDGYLADPANNVIRSFDGANVGTFAGDGRPGFINGPVASAEFRAPTSAVQDSSGDTYVVDAGNQAIREVDASGTVSTVAGNGQIGYVNGPGSSAEFYLPTGIAFNPSDGCLYVTDTGNNVIRKIDASGNVTTYAGVQGHPGLVNGPIATAEFDSPTGIVISGTTMFVADTANSVIRIINMSTGQVATYIQ